MFKYIVDSLLYYIFIVINFFTKQTLSIIWNNYNNQIFTTIITLLLGIIIGVMVTYSFLPKNNTKKYRQKDENEQTVQNEHVVHNVHNKEKQPHKLVIIIKTIIINCCNITKWMLSLVFSPCIGL